VSSVVAWFIAFWIVGVGILAGKLTPNLRHSRELRR
jgi:hypothetical protein